ncbi:MAG: MaoC/PaaZ C-terminal domain-containing protein [Mariniblastus sp.]|nr:MaoC/PaaZ C-terminal domain-containing protein [Mariniblastus sp.]
MESPLYFDDLVLDRVWVSPRRTVTEADVIQFATMTGDFNPLHVDYDFASKSHYRQPIAHGLLGISWVAGLGSYFPSVNTLAFTAVRNWDFCRPLYFGDTVFVETTCQEKSPSGRRAGKVVWLRKLINQDGQIVQEGVFETLVAIKTAGTPHMKRQAHQPGVQPMQAVDQSAAINDGGSSDPLNSASTL